MGILALEQEERSLAYYSLLLILSLLALFNGGINHNVIYWAFFIAIIVVGYYIYNSNIKIDFSLNSPLLWYTLFWLWSGISIIWTISPHWTVIGFLKLTLYGVLFVLATQISKQEMKKLYKLIILLAIGLIILGVLNYLFVSSGRMKSTFYNPNPFGIYVGMLLLFRIGIKLRNDNCYFDLGSTLLLVGIILSGSRGSIIACVLALPLVFIGLDKKKLIEGIKRISIIIIIALIIVQLIIFSAPYLQKNFNNKKLSNILIRSEGFISSSIGGRLSFWKTALDLFKNKPMYGYGLGSYHLASNLNYDGGVWYARFAHNNYLQILSELGLMGLILFLGFLFFIARKIVIKIKRSNESNYIYAIISMLTGFLLHTAIDFTWEFSAVTAVFFIGAGIVSANDHNQKKNNLKLKKNRLLVVLILLFIIGSCSFFSDKLSTKGYNLLLNGNVNSANHYYQLAAKVYPINPETHYFISKNYLNLFNKTANRTFLNKALVKAKKSVELSPFNGMYQNNLGIVYWKLSKYKEAEEHLVLGVEYGAYLIDRYLDLGYFYYKQGRNNKAISTLKKGLTLKEDALIAANKSYKKTRKQEVIKTLINVNSLLAKIYKQNNNNIQLENRIKEIKRLKEVKRRLYN